MVIQRHSLDSAKTAHMSLAKVMAGHGTTGMRNHPIHGNYPDPKRIIEKARKLGFLLRSGLSSFNYGDKWLTWAKDIEEMIKHRRCNLIDMYRTFLLIAPASNDSLFLRQMIKQKVSLNF